MQFDRHNQPFIRVPHSQSQLILTPPRLTDSEAVFAILNDRRVYMNLLGPPFPYTQRDWDDWFPTISKTAADALSEYTEAEKVRQAGNGTTQKWVSTGLPVMAIREVSEDTGDMTFLGEINIRRRAFLTVLDEDERKRMKDGNDSFAPGDPRIQWEVGCKFPIHLGRSSLLPPQDLFLTGLLVYLSPSAHGRGIMPAVLQVLLDTFLIPYMNVHHITGAYFEHNRASRRVFEKTGFVLEKVVPEAIELPETKTGVKGQKVGVGIMGWDWQRR